MKKIIKVLLLITLFIPFTKVNAGLTVTMSSAGNDYKDLYWLDLENNVERGIIQDQGINSTDGYRVYHYPGSYYKGSLGGTTFTSVCIDPGAKKTSSSYNCEIYENNAMKSLFIKEYNKEYTKQRYEFNLAIRLMAADAGIISFSNTSSMTMYNKHHQAAFAEGNKGSLKSGQVGALFNGALSIIGEASEITDKEEDEVKFEAKYVSVTRDDSSTKVVFQITASKRLVEVPQFECISGCSGKVDVSWTPGSRVGKITVIYPACKVGGPAISCATSVRIKYVASGDDDGDLYLCHPNGGSGGSPSNEQYFVTYIPGKALDNYVDVGSVTSPKSASKTAKEAVIPLTMPSNVEKEVCQCKIPEDCNCGKDPKDSWDIKLCCEDADSTESYVSEPKINDLFCIKKKKCDTEEDIYVQGAYVLPQAAGYEIDEKPVAGSNLCVIYCTERVYVQIPGPNNGVNGKYFELRKIPGRGDGPFVYGNFSCRNVIDYDDWLNEVISLNEDSVEQYNKYQYNLASWQAYEDAWEKYKNNYKEESTVINIQYSGTCTGDHDTSTSGSATKTCTVTYYSNSYIGEQYQYSYRGAKIKYNPEENNFVDGFKGLKVLPKDNNQLGEQNVMGFYDTKYKNNNTYNCDTEPAAAEDVDLECDDVEYTTSENLTVCDETTCGGDDQYCGGSTCYTKHSEATSGKASSRSGSSPTLPDIKSSFDSNKSTFLTNYEAAAKAYQTDVQKLAKLEKDLKTCDEYFDEKGKDTGWIESKIDTSATFSWFFTYISVASEIKKAEDHFVSFSPSYSFTTMGEYKGGTPSGYESKEIEDAGIEVPHYNEHDGHNDATASKYEFVVEPITCNNNSDTCKKGDGDTVKALVSKDALVNSQKYTSDTLYKYEITYTNDESNNKYTVYPYGGYTASMSTEKRAFTKHSGREYIEYSTLKGTYQTTWVFSGIGSDGKFDDKFKGNDCAGEGSNSSNTEFYCKLQVDSSLTKIRGCDSGIISGKAGSSSGWEKLCCKGDCEATNDDTLSFAFKIVDSTKLFPGSSGNKVSGYTKDDAPTGSRKGSTSLEPYADNWFRTDAARKVLQNIEKNSGNENEFGTERITYQFHLNSKAIDSIKKYNSYINNYNSLVKGNYQIGADETGPASKYYSDFITRYYEGKLDIINPATGGVKDTITLKTKSYGGQPALDKARNRVHWNGVI